MKESNVKRLQKKLREEEIQHYVTFGPNPNSEWLLGKTLFSRHVISVPARGKIKVLLTEMDKTIFKKGEVFEDKKEISQFLEKIKGKISSDFSEKTGNNYLSRKDYSLLKKNSGKKLEPADFIYDLRQIKQDFEIKKLKKAAKITTAVLGGIPSFFKKEMTEKELRAEIDYRINKRAEISFPTIVASGKNAGKPHHTPSDKKIKNGELVIVDCGARCGLYCADMTNTFTVGPARNSQKIEKVREVKEKCLSKIEAGAEFKSVYEIAKKALGKHFIHALGHSIGIETHDLGPSFSKKCKDKIQPGHTFAVEPGHYTSLYGIRLEEDFFVDKKGKPKLFAPLPSINKI